MRLKMMILQALLIYISYDNNKFEKLSKILDTLTQAYERITNKKGINIELHEKFDILTPSKLIPSLKTE